VTYGLALIHASVSSTFNVNGAGAACTSHQLVIDTRKYCVRPRITGIHRHTAQYMYSCTAFSVVGSLPDQLPDPSTSQQGDQTLTQLLQYKRASSRAINTFSALELVSV